MKHLVALCGMLTLAACTATGGAPASDYVAGFNEPFLNYRSDGATLRFTSPEVMQGATILAEREQTADGVRFVWSDADNARHLLEIERGQCFDDMSGLEFSHRARLTMAGMAAPLTGCARLTTEPQPREL